MATIEVCDLCGDRIDADEEFAAELVSHRDGIENQDACYQCLYTLAKYGRG